MKVKFDMKMLGKDLAERRRAQGASLQEIANKTKLPKCTVFRIEKGKQKDIHVTTLNKICGYTLFHPATYFTIV